MLPELRRAWTHGFLPRLPARRERHGLKTEILKAHRSGVCRRLRSCGEDAKPPTASSIAKPLRRPCDAGTTSWHGTEVFATWLMAVGWPACCLLGRDFSVNPAREWWFSPPFPEPGISSSYPHSRRSRRSLLYRSPRLPRICPPSCRLRGLHLCVSWDLPAAA